VLPLVTSDSGLLLNMDVKRGDLNEWNK
jgi:hypothetical protein